MNLVDGLSSASQVESPVSVSESPLFERKFSAVYDFLEQGRINVFRLRRIMPQDIERVKSETTDSHVGAEQVKRLASQGRSLKVVVARL